MPICSGKRLYPGSFPKIVLVLLLSGCMSEHSVTTRPVYAYPQNLEAICGKTLTLNLDNTGEFFTSGHHKEQTGEVLLSAQLLENEPEEHRQYRSLSLDFSPDNPLLITTFDAKGAANTQAFPPERISCGPDGELVLSFPSLSSYFWASVITRGKTLALWTDRKGGLVIQNRWSENLAGIIGGTTSGDAWASFAPAALASPVGDQHSPDAIASGFNTTKEGCPILDGEYEPEARIIHLDGSLAVRTAIEQFFREEIIGPHPVNQETTSVDLFTVSRSNLSALEFRLFNQGELLVTRSVAAADIRCEEARWHISGDKLFASAWLLLIGSGGVSWENLSLWRDQSGNLLVQGIFKRRNAIFLIPMGDTESLFMVFPRKPAVIAD